MEVQIKLLKGKRHMKKKIKKPNLSNKPHVAGLGYEMCPIHKAIYKHGGHCPKCTNNKKSK